MQRQLEKIGDVVRLIAQKLEISAEMEVNDTSKSDKKEIYNTRVQRYRQSISVTHRIPNIQSPTSHTSSYEPLHTENA